MKGLRILIFTIMLLVSLIGCSPPFPVRGSLKTIAQFPSKYVEPRRVDIWLPEGYSDKNTYAVVYMHDGQNLFDPAFGYGGQIWAVDEALQVLINKKKVRPAIVVAIWSTAKRIQEYLPVPAFELLSSDRRTLLRSERIDHPISDNYLKFIVEELKPFVDRNFATASERTGTFIMGSDMGGMVSLYALAEYPAVFGGAASMSTHWPLSLEQNDPGYSIPYIQWLRRHLPPPLVHRIYFDFGTETLDARYAMHQQLMDDAMKSAGYELGALWTSKKFQGDGHNEASWRKRVQIPLEFLLKE